mgnify:CR=1 FL=1
MLSKPEARALALMVVAQIGRPADELRALEITQTRTESQVTIKVHYLTRNSADLQEGETFIFNAEEL